MTGATPARRAAVIGGGISGLAAAFDLQRAGWRVQVHESGPRWGGKIWSSTVGDRLVDAGPDTFLARVEPGRRLCRDLGLEAELTSPVAPVPAYIAHRGVLHELPPGSMLGVPTDLEALARSGLVSDDGVQRAAEDLTAAPTSMGEDISVGALCRARLGDEVTDLLIDPLLGGINASDIDRLSLNAGAPLLAAAMKRSPSLIEGLRLVRPASGPTLGTAENEPVFFGLPGGIARIIDALVAALSPEAELHLNSPIAGLDDLPSDIDAVIVATPAVAASKIVGALSPSAAEELATIDYASVAQVTVELPLTAVATELDASGILFPRVGGTIMTACTWFSTKWAHYRKPGTVLLRLTSGRFGDVRNAALSDEELTTTLLGELDPIIEVSGQPTAVRVKRWNNAFPQYTPGHGARVDRIAEALTADRADGARGVASLRLCGAAYRGIGIPACIESGRNAAGSLIDELG